MKNKMTEQDYVDMIEYQLMLIKDLEQQNKNLDKFIIHILKHGG